MAINEAVNIDIDVNGVNTVKQAADAYEDLGDAVSQTQLEAEKLAQQFGINDKRTQEAIKEAGRYKQQLEELDFAIDGARGGAEQMFRAAQGVTAGFELAAGATALFGTESEERKYIHAMKYNDFENTKELNRVTRISKELYNEGYNILYNLSLRLNKRWSEKPNIHNKEIVLNYPKPNDKSNKMFDYFN